MTGLTAAVARARDAVGGRASAFETAVIGAQDGDELTGKLRAISRQEAEIQAELRSAGESLTQAEVRSAQLRDRRSDQETELAGIAARLERELEPAQEPLPAAERDEVERKLERLARRREQLGPVNPLAEREYEEAKGRVDEFEAQRGDLESALSELKKLIRETDRTMTTAFEETLAETSRNFEELVEHLFPGGRGRLRLTEPQGPRPVIGGGDASAVDTTATCNDGAGTYVLQLAADDGVNPPVSDTVTITVIPEGGGNMIEVRVGAATDDAEEKIGTSAVTLGSSDLELVMEASAQIIGIRFTNITIPQGAAITSAYVQFTVDEGNSDVTSLTVKGQAAANAPTFTATNGNISSRPLTTASVAWDNVPPWTSIGEAGPA